MTTGLASCINCKHFNIKEVNCTAFPERIPLEIMQGFNDHTKPYRGDNGIRFERKKDVRSK